MFDMSERLKEKIHLSCFQMQNGRLTSLEEEIQKGVDRWFIKEFADAITAGLLTPAVWGKLIGTDYAADAQSETEEDLRDVWETIAPGQDFPGEEARFRDSKEYPAK